MLTYERPTLTKAGSFKQMTGAGGTGPKDAVTKKQLLSVDRNLCSGWTTRRGTGRSRRDHERFNRL